MRACSFLLLLISGITQAQFRYELDQSIPVTGEALTALKLPWAGGLNAVQFNTFDLNEDGEEDLIVFDRMANAVRTFIRDNDQYQYAPQYEILFPSGITNWLLLRDFNGDGKKDIFTGDVMGIKVYVNQTIAGGSLQWQQFYFYRGPGVPKSPVLLSVGSNPNQKIVVQLNFDDLPSLVDVDGDGDLDLFAPRFVAESSFEYHRNNSVENSWGTDSLDFTRITQAWAGVRECACGEFAFNNAECPPLPAGREEHAGGKSLLAIDIDNDGDHDILFSEGECDQLYLFENTGTDANPIVTTAVPYPETNSIINFPAAYYEDVNFDGIQDLIVSPNLFAREFAETNFKESVWLYTNSGTTAAPIFNTPAQNFLQSGMLDVGDNAVPAFFDIDNDGDLDLFVGCFINNAYNAASVYFFENTGTATEPQFTFVTDNYRALAGSNFVNLKPMFADVNSDGKKDFVFTAQSGNTSQLYYIANTGTTIPDFSGSVTALNFTLFWRDENVTLADVNSDGKPDLIVGKLNGSLEYWKNTGTPAAPAFTLEQPNYLNLSSTTLRQNPSVTTADLKGDGKDDLIFGDQSGVLTIISNYREVTDASAIGKTEIIYNSILNQYVTQNLGGRIWPTAANVLGMTETQIIVGTLLGGVRILKTSSHVVGVPDNEPMPSIKVYPNPVLAGRILTLEADYPAEIEIFSVLGQRTGKTLSIEANEPFQFELPAQLKGVYILRFAIRGKNYSRKIVIR